jgi:hypothetical protein
MVLADPAVTPQLNGEYRIAALSMVTVLVGTCAWTFQLKSDKKNNRTPVPSDREN